MHKPLNSIGKLFGLTLLVALLTSCNLFLTPHDQAPLGLSKDQLWNFITIEDPAGNQPPGQLPDDPHYETWSLFPGPPDNQSEFLNKRLGLAVHGRWVSVYANPIANTYVSEYLARVDAGDGEVPLAELPPGSIMVKLNYPNVQEQNVIAQAPNPAVLTVAYKPSDDYCETGVKYNGVACLGGNWMWAFYGLESEVNGVTLPREGQDKPVTENTQSFCVNCHDPGSRADYLRGLQRLAETAAHKQGPTSDPAVPPAAPSGDPFCESITLTSDFPGDVSLDPTTIDDPAQRQKMFDCFSWRTFVALNWPALNSERGAADTAKKFGDITDGVDTVWETYKATWEVFQPENIKWDPMQEGNPAGDWNSPRSLPPACPSDSDLPVVANVTKTASRFPDNVNESGQAFAGSFGTLTDRNGELVRYLVLFNETSFDFIVPNAATTKLSPSGPHDGVSTDVPDGAIEVKSSWKVLCLEDDCKPPDDPADYYSRDVLFYEAEKGTCEPATVGLTGLHVIGKTFWAPQWIWATFEHVSNAPTGPTEDDNFSFNDPACKPTDDFLFTACSTQPFLAPKSVGEHSVGDPCCSNGELNRFQGIGFGDEPNQVTRLDRIGGSGLNEVFAAKIKAETRGKSPFSNYLLVNTQWPFNGRRPAETDGDPLYVNNQLCPSQQDISSDPLRPVDTFPSDCYTMIPTFLRNTSMETYMATYVEQNSRAVQVSNRSCMGCHASGNDFSYLWLDAVEQVVCIDDPANGCKCEQSDGRFVLVCSEP